MVKKIVLWIAVILWMSVIFSFSAQPAEQSGELSKGIIYKCIEFLASIDNIPVFNQMDSDHIYELSYRLDHYVRKLAHFTIYAVLGVLVYNLLATYGIKRSKVVLLSAAICLGYAISDEVHQLFVPGRAGMVRDVFIDFGGAFFAISVAYLFFGRHVHKEGIR